MKKLLLSMAAITMLFSSCSNEDLMSDVIGQGDAMVQFSLEVAETPQLKTQNGMLKSISDGKGANQLAYSVYDANGNIITALSSSASSFTFPGNVSLNLAKGQEYTVAFWAQNSACTAYNTADLKSVKIDYTGANNDETRDAFFKTVTFTVTESENIAIELTRPFAQINVGITPEDWATAEIAGVVVDQSKVKVTGVANEINLLTGDVKGTTDVEYTMATIPAGTEILKVDADKDGVKEDYRYLSMSYILAPETTSGTGAAATTIDALEFEFQPISGSNIILKDGLVTVPVQRNWRTNIVGEILTGEINFNISIDSAYVENGDNNIAMNTLKVNGLAELEAALEANKAQSEAFVYNVEGISGLSDVAIVIPEGTQSESLTFDIIDVQNGTDLSITGTDYAKQVIVKVPEGYNAGDLTVDIPGAHVILQQGTYTSVVASTSLTSLNVTNGTTVETLTVMAGNVRIAEGGAVASIVNSKGSTLYIIAAGGTLPTTMSENTIVIYENTEKNAVINNAYSADNISDLISYSKDVLKENTINISLNNDVTEANVTIVQQEGVQVAIDGKGKYLKGMITVDGKSSAYATAGLTIKDLNFTDAISADACINLGKSGDNNTRYTSNVTIIGCTFNVSEKVGIKSYTGGDKNLTITDCTATAQAHSLLQAAGIEGILVKNCVINSKNGLNFNQSNNVVVDNCTADVKGYAARFGAGSGTTGIEEVYSIKNSSLKSANDDGDAVIILRGTAENSILNIENTTLTGDPQITNNATDAIIIIDGVATVNSAAGLAKAVQKGITTINLSDGEYDVYGCAGKTLTLSGSSNAIILLKNEGEDGCDYAFGNGSSGVGNVTFKGLTINTLGNTGNYKGFAYMKGTFNDCNFVGAYSLNNSNDFAFNNCTFDFNNGYFWTWGAKSIIFDGCTFNGNSKNILAHGSASTKITINNCTFAATEVGKTGGGVPTACVEIDPIGNNTYTINFTGNNTKSDNYAGWTRIKDGSTGHIITGIE